MKNLTLVTLFFARSLPVSSDLSPMPVLEEAINAALKPNESWAVWDGVLVGTYHVDFTLMATPAEIQDFEAKLEKHFSLFGRDLGGMHVLPTMALSRFPLLKNNVQDELLEHLIENYPLIWSHNIVAHGAES